MSSWISLLTKRITLCNPALAERSYHWIWPIGTCFGDERLWWGELKKRLAPHEGLDLIYYMDKQGAQHQIAPGVVIPTVFAGQVVQVHQDFLNQSVYIRHEQFCWNDAVLHTIYGHVQPNEGLGLGQDVGTGYPVVLLEDYPWSTVPLHLHFTVAWIPKDLPSQELSWQMLNEHEQIILVDPLAECDAEKKRVQG